MKLSTVGTHYRPIYESHQISNPFSQAPDERVVPDWLNAAKGTRSGQRVVQLIEDFRMTEGRTRLAIKAGAYHHIFRVGKRKRYPSNKLRLQRASNAPFMKLVRALEKYQFELKITHVYTSNQWLPHLACRVKSGDFCIELEEGKYRTKGRQTPIQDSRAFEGDIVFAISRLAGRGLLDRIKRCGKYSKWLFPSKSHYKNCSDECRQTF